MKMQIVRFGDLYAIPSGNGLSRPTAVRGEGYRMIGMGELFANDIINDMEMVRVQMSDREKQSFFVEPDDLLFARQSLVAAGAGKCSIVKELEEPTTYESHLIRVRLDKNKCNPWYYYYLFKLPDNPIKTIVNQCAQAGIRGNELVKIKVPLPPRPCQDRIVSVLSSYDKLIEATISGSKCWNRWRKTCIRSGLSVSAFPAMKQRSSWMVFQMIGSILSLIKCWM